MKIENLKLNKKQKTCIDMILFLFLFTGIILITLSIIFIL